MLGHTTAESSLGGREESELATKLGAGFDWCAPALETAAGVRRLASSADRPGCGGVGIRGSSEAEIDGASEARFGVGTDGLGARLVGGRDG